MLINPLKLETKCEIEKHKYETSKDTAIGEIISYLISNYSDYLSDININREIVENIVREKVYKEYSNMNTESTINTILNRLFGYHILQKYIEDKNITDIRVTKFDNIFVKEFGVWKKTKDSFTSENDFLNFVRYCVLKNGGKITNETPIVTVSDRKNNLRIEWSVCYGKRCKVYSVTTITRGNNTPITGTTIILMITLYRDISYWNHAIIGIVNIVM